MPLNDPADRREGSSAQFERDASQQGDGVVREFVAYLRGSKKWWLTPIVLMMLLLAVLIVLGGSGAAPFIYTLL